MKIMSEQDTDRCASGHRDHRDPRRFTVPSDPCDTTQQETLSC